MIRRIKTTAVYVADQERALRFYTEKLGFELRADHAMGPEARWIEVAPLGAESHVVLFPRSMRKDWEALRPSLTFDCLDTVATHRELAARGVTFTQNPTRMPWGTFAKLVDPDGNELVLSDAP